MSARPLHSFLQTQIDMIYPQRRKILIRPLQIQEQPSKTHEYLSKPHISHSTRSTKSEVQQGHSHVILLPLLKSIDLPIAHIIIIIRHARLPPAHISPPFAVIFRPVERECGGEE